jgi:hypothetical protein
MLGEEGGDVGCNSMGGRCRLAGTKGLVVVHPLRGTGKVVERGVSGDVCHGKLFEAFVRGIAITKLSGKLVRGLGGWYMDLD